MKTSNLFTTLSAWALGVFLCMGTISTAFAVDALDFELEGNAVSPGGVAPPFLNVDNDGIPVIVREDWETLVNDTNDDGGNCGDDGGKGCGGSQVYTGVVPDQAGVGGVVDDRTFATGWSKDYYDISSAGIGSKYWKNAVHSGPPDKTDITNAQVAAYRQTGNSGVVGVSGSCWDVSAEEVIDCTSADPADEPLHQDGDQIFYFEGDRVANNGDTFMGYWFFQKTVTVDEENGRFNGVHTLGDILILVNYPQGANAEPEIRVLEWNPIAPTEPEGNLALLYESTAAKCDGSNSKVACAISNDEDGANDPTHSPWPYIDKDGIVNLFDYESIIEGGINMTRATGGSRCFSSFMAETRSSKEVNATLKDFVLRGFEVCGIEADKFCDAEFSETVGSIDVDFNGYVENSGLLPLDLTVSDDMGLITEVCLYTGVGTPTSTEVCDSVNDIPLVPAPVIAGGIATFTLDEGMFAIYEGDYMDSSPAFDASTGEFVLTDQITAIATEVGLTAEIDRAEPIAECRLPGVPEIGISKACTGDEATADGNSNFSITGGGANTGDIMLTNVYLDDTVLIGNGAITNLLIFVDGDPTPVGNPFDLPAGSFYTYTAEASHTDGLEHQDSMTVTADNPFTGQPIPFDAEVHTATTDVCFNEVFPDIEVTKVCTVFLSTTVNPGNITVGVRITGSVTNIGDVDLTGVDVDDLDPEVAAVVGQLVTDETLAANGGTVNYGPVEYYPSHTEIEPGAGGLGFTNTVEAIGTPPFGLDDVSDQAESLECLLCPELPPEPD